VIIAQTLGFGTDAAGVKAFGSSAAPLGDLSKDYVGSAPSDLINLGAMIGAFASGLGTATAGSRFLFVAGRRAPLWQIVIALVAIALLGYTIYKNVEGTSFPYDRFPYVVGAWLVIGIAITVALPALTRSIGTGLARSEGLAQDFVRVS
jgi:hypothetical protein